MTMGNKNDLLKLNLKRKVKSLTETSFPITETLFPKTVKGLEEIHRGHKDSEDVLQFNDKGNIIEKCHFLSSESLDFKILYKYDEKDNIIEEKNYKAEGNLKIKITFIYKYDESGKMN